MTAQLAKHMKSEPLSKNAIEAAIKALKKWPAARKIGAHWFAVEPPATFRAAFDSTEIIAAKDIDFASEYG